MFANNEIYAWLNSIPYDPSPAFQLQRGIQESEASIIPRQASRPKATRSVNMRISRHCLYIRAFKECGYSCDDEIYYAVYLQQLSLKELIGSVSRKFIFTEGQVVSATIIDCQGAAIPLDDDAVQNIPSEQPMSFEFKPHTEAGLIVNDSHSISLKYRLLLHFQPS
ncbi:hypothetical protein P170DRAFT_174665 [Aspergillus steynii IBT 23096]|uniref:GRHL1/CP2 C-terminal domain-containing protein n=1 Tax=Aspergillus steynii IBT 23096 TaxID=1392250 RepID=A0A2I2G862_9EURO|nr:uncharacterized protein P170DRAFT_174665 [Aspergillus steynii IBT 23096]PLB49080.1 hypothetical protein P170DRAFT_174665 [Aspergillus steynii IBT 23096]